MSHFANEHWKELAVEQAEDSLRYCNTMSSAIDLIDAYQNMEDSTQTRVMQLLKIPKPKKSTWKHALRINDNYNKSSQGVKDEVVGHFAEVYYLDQWQHD